MDSMCHCVSKTNYNLIFLSYTLLSYTLIKFLCTKRFNKKWLKYGYSDKNKVIRDGENGILSREVVKVLLGVHKRHETLANGPSQMDIYRLKHVYSGNVLQLQIDTKLHTKIN